MTLNFTGIPAQEGPDIRSQNIALKIMLGVVILLVVLLFGLVLSFVFRYENLRADCQQKLDYWVNKCADVIPNEIAVLNITIPYDSGAVLSTLEGQ